MLEKLRQYPIMNQLKQEDLEDILPHVSENEYAAGTIILQQGQVSDKFHILLSGVVDVYLEHELKVSVAKLAPGHFFGEMSCLTGEPVSATVRAEEPVRTLSMLRPGILQLMESSSSFQKQMIEAMIKRISSSNERVVEEHTRSLVVMQQMEQEIQSRYGSLVGSSLFMRNLREQVDKLANQEEVVCIVGEQGVGKCHIASEIHYRSTQGYYPIILIDGESFSLEEWEMKVRGAKGGTIILKHADQLPTDVLQRLIQSKDEVRLIITGRQFPEVQAEQVKVIPLRERAEDIPELVYEFLLKLGVAHPQESISQEAMNMISIFPFLKDNIEGLKRLVQEALVLSQGKIIRNAHLRFDRGRQPGTRPTIGLALGSGSVRGAAHVGVLKVLEEEQIPVDIIAGTSVGAFIGALYAGGQPISAFEKVLPGVRWRQLVHLALPPIALVNNQPMARFVEKYIGPVHFEELPISFAAVAADVTTGEAYILNKGKVSQAICASTAIPGVMKPVQHQNRLLVDGAVVHAVPAALAKSMGADIVIAVDVSIPSFTKRSPKNFVSSILNTIDIMSKKIVREEMQLADVVLNPYLEMNQITFKASASFIQAGEKVTHEALSAIKAKINASMT